MYLKRMHTFITKIFLAGYTIFSLNIKVHLHRVARFDGGMFAFVRLLQRSVDCQSRFLSHSEPSRLSCASMLFVGMYLVGPFDRARKLCIFKLLVRCASRGEAL